jgi:predicted nucleotidyltransferase
MPLPGNLRPADHLSASATGNRSRPPRDPASTRLKVEPKTGMIDPNMGSSDNVTAETGLADALFPRVRQRVLALLFGNPDRSFFSNEVVALAQSGTGAVQRELASLSQAGLLTVTSRGNQKHYRANKAAPVFKELHGLILKTSGLVDILRSALAPLASQIEAAFVYGSVAKRTDTASSDVDVMIVSDALGYAEVFSALEPTARRLGRTVNPTLYSHAEFGKRIKQNNAFATRVLKQDKIWLIGSKQAL